MECIWLCSNDWTHLEVRVQEIVDCGHVRGFHTVRIHFGLNPLDHSLPQPVTVRQETHDCTRATDNEHSGRFLNDNAQRRSALMNKTEGTYRGSHPSWWIFLQIKRPKKKSKLILLHTDVSSCSRRLVNFKVNAFATKMGEKLPRQGPLCSACILVLVMQASLCSSQWFL